MNPTNEWLSDLIEAAELMAALEVGRPAGDDWNDTLTAIRELLARRKADEGAVTVKGVIDGENPSSESAGMRWLRLGNLYGKIPWSADTAVTVAIRKEGA